MASLDQMEGDAVETAVFLIVALIVVAIVLFYLGDRRLLSWLNGLLSRFVAWIKDRFSGGSGAFNPSGTGSGSMSGSGTEDISTGTAFGQEGPPPDGSAWWDSNGNYHSGSMTPVGGG